MSTASGCRKLRTAKVNTPAPSASDTPRSTLPIRGRPTRMVAPVVRGRFSWGQNPAAGEAAYGGHCTGSVGGGLCRGWAALRCDGLEAEAVGRRAEHEDVAGQEPEVLRGVPAL